MDGVSDVDFRRRGECARGRLMKVGGWGRGEAAVSEYSVADERVGRGGGDWEGEMGDEES